jgi:arsenate reductase (glutaredoxin)
MMKIYHNPRCSKSRETLNIIKESGQEVEVIEYLKTPPTVEELEDVLAKLNLPIEYLIRTGEEIYKTEYKGKNLTDAEWIEALVEHPNMLERPIVVKDDQAILGRPPANVQKLL